MRQRRQRVGRQRRALLTRQDARREQRAQARRVGPARAVQARIDPARIMLRLDLDDVARDPGCRVSRRLQRDMPCLAAAAARVEQPPLDQPPVLHRRGRPVGLVGARAQPRQLLLPLALRIDGIAVHLDRIEQALRAAIVQPAIDAVAERAEVRIFAVAEREHRIAEVRQVARRLRQPPREAARAIGRLALAIGARDDEQSTRAPQRRRVEVGDGQDLRVGESLRGQARDSLRRAGLRGVGDQGAAVARCSGRLGRYGHGGERRLAPPPRQIEQQAGDREQRHGQAREHHRQPPGQSEIGATVNLVDAGDDVLPPAALGIGGDGNGRARCRVDRYLVRDAVVARVGQLGAELDFAVPCGSGDRVVGARTGGAIEAAPCDGPIDRRVLPALLFLTARLGRFGDEQVAQSGAIPVVGPPQAGSRADEVEEQHPATDHRMQRTIQVAPRAPQVEHQPVAPIERTPRPTQVQARQREEDQRQRRKARDLPADPLAAARQGEPAVQILDRVDDPLAPRRAEVATGDGIEIGDMPRLGLACRVAEDRRARRIARHHQPHDARVGMLRRQAGGEIGARQAGAGLRRHGGDAGVERRDDLGRETERRAGHAHHGKHEACSDAEEPVDLEQQRARHLSHSIHCC